LKRWWLIRLADINLIKNRLDIIEQNIAREDDHFIRYVFKDVVLECINDIRKVLERYEFRERLKIEKRRRYARRANRKYRRMRRLVENSGLFDTVRIAGFIFYRYRDGRIYSLEQAYAIAKKITFTSLKSI